MGPWMVEDGSSGDLLLGNENEGDLALVTGTLDRQVRSQVTVRQRVVRRISGYALLASHHNPIISTVSLPSLRSLIMPKTSNDFWRPL